MMAAVRSLPALVLLLIAFATQAQPRVGVLTFTEVGDDFKRGFVAALRSHGYEEGRNVAIEWRSAGASMDGARKHAAELVALKVDVLVVRLTPAVHAARSATSRIPIVMAGAGDPLGTGLVSNLARPGGNITGIAGLAAEVSGKRIELLQELLPGLKRIGLLTNTADPFAKPFISESEAAAAKLGVAVVRADVRKAPDVPGALRALKASGAQAVIVQGILSEPSWRAGDVAVEAGLPAVSFVPPFAASGGLMELSNSRVEIIERSASYVARILDGAKPGDLPVEQPSRFELTINLRAAKALGLTVPRSLLLRADQVIE
jgi:putative ABC transport system substrate-binding protein